MKLEMNKDFVVDTGQKFISNVLGGAGAIWGSSEVVCLRNNTNKRLWRGIMFPLRSFNSLNIWIIFLVRVRLIWKISCIRVIMHYLENYL